MFSANFIKKCIVFCAILGLTAGFSGTKALAAGINQTPEKYSMSYIYFGGSNTYTTSVDRSQNSIDTISPSYFDLNPDGTLKLTPAANAEFAQQMHDRGIRVTPFLSNHWVRDDGRSALANRESLTTRIAYEMERLNLDGINVDIENMTSADRADYTDFVRLLRQKLPADKTVSVAVAAYGAGVNEWQLSYDYAGLSDVLTGPNDYLVIMAYDEHSQDGPAGPVSSAGFVERSIEYALTQAPKEKIVLGVPFYGRIWNNSKSGSPQGLGISNTVIDSLIADYRGQVTIDQSGSAKAVITLSASDPKPTAGGVTLKAGTYTIWYENEQTLKNLLTLVQTYDLKGVSHWSLGQESANTWDYYKLWLNGCTLADIQAHWAKEAVFEAYQAGLMQGISPDAFSPDGSLTRAQAAVILARMLDIDVSAGGEGFADTEGHWADAEIKAIRSYGLINGVGNNRFEPDRPVTREEICVILQNLLLAEGVAIVNPPRNFLDVSLAANPWSFDAVVNASRMGLIYGYDDGSFRPQATLTRAEMAVIAGRTAAVLS